MLRKINLIINSTHLSRLISANWTFHICDHNRSFPQTKKRSFHKISFSIDPYFHLLCCLGEELWAIDYYATELSADRSADKMRDIQWESAYWLVLLTWLL